MRTFIILFTLLASGLTLADDSIYLGGIPNYYQKLVITDALNSIGAGQSVEVPLTSSSYASGDPFFILNPVGYLVACPGATAERNARSNAEHLCSSITGIGSVTEVLDTKGSCRYENWIHDQRVCECSSSVAFTCKITKP